MARDNGSPARSATAVVIVDIQRNFQPPVWTSNALFAASIAENQPLGVPFVTVDADDFDSQVITNDFVFRHEQILLDTLNNVDLKVSGIFVDV